MLKKLLKIQEAASFLNVSIRTLQRYDKKGLLVPLRTPGGQRRYLIDKLEEFKKSRSSNPSDLEPLVFGYPKALRVKRQRLSKTHLKKAIKLKDSLFENSSNLVTVQNAAYILGVSAMTLRRWDKAKILVPLRTIGGQRRYLRDQVEALQRQSLEKSYNPEAISFARGRLGASTLDLGTPIKIDKPKEKPFAKSYLAFEFSKSQKAILFSSLFVFAMFLVITIFAKTNLLKLHLLEDLFLSSSPPTKDVAGLYNDKGVVLGEHTEGNNLFFNINVPSIFKGIATFSAGLITDNQDINAGTGRVTASNVLYEVVAGSGISIEGDPQRPTIVNEVELTAGSGVSISGTKISNTGVLSLGGKTGDVKLSAGTGISISDVTITNSGVTSLTGTSNQVTVSGSTGSVTLSLPQSIGASSSPSFAGLTLSNFTSNGGVIYTNASGVLAQVTAGTSTQCLLGGTTPAFGSCGAEADTFWNQSSGALFPNNATVDLLIGATATTSAKFGVLNINSGTPTASASAGAAGATYFTAAGLIQTTAAQTLTLGGSTTGNIVIDSGSSSITLSDDTTISGDLAVNGATSADITSTTTTGTLFNTTVTTLSLGGAATTLSVGASTGTTTVNNALTVTGAGTFNNTFTNTNRTTSNSVINLTSTGDLVFQDSGVTVLTFTDAGLLTLASQAPTEGANFIAVTNTAGAGTSYDILDIALTAPSADAAAADTARAIALTIPTPAEATDTIVGLAVVGATATAGTEVALDISAITAGAGTETAVCLLVLAGIQTLPLLIVL